MLGYTNNYIVKYVKKCKKWIIYLYFVYLGMVIHPLMGFQWIYMGHGHPTHDINPYGGYINPYSMF